MEVLFAGIEVLFIFYSSLVEGSCVRKQADDPTELAFTAKTTGVTRTLCTPALSRAYSSPATCCQLLALLYLQFLEREIE